MIWADYGIVAALAIFVVGGSTERFWGTDSPWFIHHMPTRVVVNLTALCLLLAGLHTQDYDSGPDGGLEIFSQIATAFVRVFSWG